MYILSLGGWYIGNSAVIQWLNCFSNVELIKGDFHQLRSENGIYDLIRLNGRKKIKAHAMLTKIHLKCAFKSIFFKGSTHQYSLKHNLNILLNLFRFLGKYNSSKLEQSVFWGEALDFNNTDITILQNPIYYDDIDPCNADVWRDVFRNRKCLFVTRDPIEQFIDIYLHNDFLYGNTKFRNGTAGMDDIETFFTIVERTYKSRLSLIKEGKEKILVVSFESFAFSEEDLKEQICKYFDVKYDIQCDESFDFTYTRGNTKLREEYPEIAQIIKDGNEARLDNLYKLKAELEMLGQI